MAKTVKAAALAYGEGDAAPRLVAKGRGAEAERIIALAGKYGVSIVEEPAIEALLDASPVGGYIPPWCWEAAAKVLAFVLAEK